MSVFKRIKSEDFICSIGYEMPPKAIRYILARTEECAQLRNAYRTGNISETELRRYIQSMMKDFVPGTKFPYDMTLSLVAVSLEPFFTGFADEYLSTLTNLELSEMPLSIRVAKLCVQARQQRAKNSFRTFSVSPTSVFNVCRNPFIARESAVQKNTNDCYLKVEAA